MSLTEQKVSVDYELHLNEKSSTLWILFKLGKYFVYWRSSMIIIAKKIVFLRIVDINLFACSKVLTEINKRIKQIFNLLGLR